MKGISIFTVIALLVGTSCAKYDNARPKVEQFVVNASEDNEQTFAAGDKIVLTASYSDNRELSRGTFLLSSGFYGQTNVTRNPENSLYYSNIFELSGEKKGTEQTVVASPSTLAGPYNVQTYCEDEAGHESHRRIYNIITTHPNMPVVDIQNVGPGLNGNLVFIRAGANVSFRGLASADASGSELTLARLDIIAPAGYTEFTKDIVLTNSTNPGEPVTQYDLADLGAFTVPASTIKGDYKMLFTITNALGHQNVRVFKLKVLS